MNDKKWERTHHADILDLKKKKKQKEELYKLSHSFTSTFLAFFDYNGKLVQRND